MKKLAWLALVGLTVTAPVAFAADALNGSQWKTIDDKTGKPKAVVEFKEQANGTLSATIKELLDPAAAKVCDSCKGNLKGTSMVGLTIVTNLKQVGDNKYEGGTILDPKSGSTYSLKGQVTPNGQKFELRGYKGVAALGRNQTWQRVR